jgi:hypothetical protein
MAWTPERLTKSNAKQETVNEAQLRVGRELKAEYGIRDTQYMQSCSTCHR